ncbi:MAG: bifunctional 5,10-methylenetetrahydrofolate dehydrogenase/5,10-methenyltetrahydrofolate cyclohydrolase [Armatimonadetes bacterium]|nr:bifunctional 5,10-methylenetetrahydrofolate dehydrogenase/5,10-methenyltetrahydrofolate cyclohydrolase [Armatimonadota bacterium]
MARIMDGRALAGEVMDRVAQDVADLAARHGARPGLATLVVGGEPVDHVHARYKHEACKRLGMHSRGVTLPAGSTSEQVVRAVRALEEDPEIHGIFVHLPLPGGVDARTVLMSIPLDKDIDAVHPATLGQLAAAGGEPRFLPCTAAACLRLLENCGVLIRSAKAVVVGKSHYAAVPTALLLLREGATVEIVPEGNRFLEQEVRTADIVIAAIGRPAFVTAAMLKPGAAVIDLGAHRIAGTLRGDVDLEGAMEVAGAIAPVPGGAGPMTVAMLMSNTLEAARLRRDR